MLKACPKGQAVFFFFFFSDAGIASKKNAPAKRQERMSLEGSAPLSQNPEGNTAVAISDVNDTQIIAQERGERIKVAL